MKKYFLYSLLFLAFVVGLSSSARAQMILEFVTTTNNDYINLPLKGTVDVTVAWGDGSSNNYTTPGLKYHNYAIAGTHTVKISGTTLTGFGGTSTNNYHKVTKVTSWGDFDLTDLSCAFHFCHNLVEVPDNLPVTVTNTSKMFYYAEIFNQNINAWDVHAVTDMSEMFYFAMAFNGDISGWNVSAVTNMSEMFYRAYAFNGDISGWNVSEVTNMNLMFFGATVFNRDISNWNVSKVTDMQAMFCEASAFNQNIPNWDVSKVTNMYKMFCEARAFNGDISNWDVSAVTNMDLMFSRANVFNRDISGWDVSAVTTMRKMFWEAYAFNGVISAWDVSAVTDMKQMFYSASAFNQNISGWDVSAVTDMYYMFTNALAFNQDVSNWNVSAVTIMRGMFWGASLFNQDISNWNISAVTDMEYMLKDVTLSTAYYDALLTAWASQIVKSGLEFSGGNSTYTEATARSILTSAPNNWTITDGGGPDADGTLTAATGVNEPIALPTTITTAGTPTNIMDFTLTDGGASDGLAMMISQIVVHTSGTGDFNKVTWRLKGLDADHVTGNYNAVTKTITFPALTISISNNTNETYTVNAYYNDNTGLTDNSTYILSIEGDIDVTCSTSGTQMNATNTVINNGTGSTVDVTATKLAFGTQPSETAADANISDFTVELQDAVGNVDIDLANAITLSISNNAGTSTLSGTNPVNAVAGIATFNVHNLNKVGTGYTLGAATGGLTSTISSAFNIIPGAPAKLVYHSQPSNNLARLTMSAFAVGVYDVNDNLVSGAITPVVLNFNANPGAATLSGTTSIVPTSGVSTFSDISVNNVGSGYTLDATSGLLTLATSNPFKIFNSNNSDIITNSGFVYPANIPYQNYQATNLTDANSVAVAQFDIRDGSGLADADVVSTILTNLTLNVSNPANIRRIAIYDGLTEIAELPASAMVSFSGLNISAADGATKTFTVRVSYNSVVTDNQQSQFTIASATTDAVNSGFAAADGSGASSSISGNNKRIEVSGTQLIYTTQPTNAIAGSAIPTFAVKVVDVNGNLDLDAGIISISINNNAGGSTFSGTTSVSAVNGVATFSNVILYKSGIGYTLNATYGGINKVSNAFDLIHCTASKLAFDIQPVNSNIDMVVPAFTVKILDAFDNLVTNSICPVTLSIDNNPGGSNLSGTSQQNAVAGITTFNNIMFDKAADGYTLNANVAPFAQAVSNAFNLKSSTNSDIIATPGFTSPAEIEYIQHQANDIQKDANSIEIAQFDIRDGASTNDADNAPTTLTDITFDVTNYLFIKRLAIYDGDVEVGEQVVSGSTVTFSGMNIAAADNSSKTFSVRASFNTTVIDNDAIGLSISSATPNNTGSLFAASNAGGAATVLGSNKINVSVSALNVISQIPAAVDVNTNLAPVVVELLDANGNRDLDYNGEILVSAFGLKNAPISVNAANGLATFENLSFTIFSYPAQLSFTNSNNQCKGLSNIFKVNDYCSPEATGSNTAQNSTDVSQSENLVLNFDEPVMYGNTGYYTIYKSNGEVFEKIWYLSSQIQYNGTSIVINPSKTFVSEEEYYVLVDNTAIKDRAENRNYFPGISDPNVWRFRASDNQAPTDIAISNRTVTENNAKGIIVGLLSTVDSVTKYDPQTHTYTLVSGDGSTDNDLFVLENGNLVLNQTTDYEAKQSYSIRVKTTDYQGETYEKVITISVQNSPETPYGLTVSNTIIAENAGNDKVIGDITTLDQDTEDTFTYNFVSGNGDTDNSLFSISGNTISAVSSLNYETSPEYSIRIKTTDSNGLTYEKVIKINITDVNETPVANGEQYQTVEDRQLTVSHDVRLLLNDTDVDGDNLNVVLVDNTTNGKLTLFKSGSFVYKPNTNFNGTDEFTYYVTDGELNSNTVTVSIAVVEVNDVPLARPESFKTNENETLTVTLNNGLLINDSDIESTLSTIIATEPTNGQLTLNDNGTFVYTPKENYNGVDYFTYYANDGTANSAATKVTITVNPVNNAPVAIADKVYTTDEDITLEVSVTEGVVTNDTDIDSDKLTAKLVSSTSNGQLVFNNDGSFTYVPNNNISGDDSFTYKAFDGLAYSNIVKVEILINALNDAPTAIAETFEVNEDSQLDGSLLANDSDLEKDVLIAELVTDPVNGTLSLNDDGTFTYIPKADFYGDDSFEYKAYDSKLYSNIVEVVINVNPVNDAPEIGLTVSQSTVVYNTKNSITGISFSDIDNEAKEVEVILSVENGILEIADNISQMTYCFGNKTNKITMKGNLDIINRSLNSTSWYSLMYKGNTNFVGTETVNILISDLGNTGAGDVQTAETSFTIEVTPVAPIITMQPQSVSLCASESTILSIAAKGTSQLTYQWQLNGTDIEGATSNIFELDNLTTENSGDYTCKIEELGFEATSEVASVNVSSIELSLEKVEIGCNGSRTGSITALTTGGQGNLLYSLNSIFDKRLNRISNVFEQLSKASYTLTVKDELGCSATASTEIGEPSAALSVKLTAKAPKCNGGTDASVEASVEGGVAPYVFDWSNGETTQTLSAIAANVYSVIVTDANGCVIDNEIRVNEPAAIEVKITNIQNERNAGQNSGSIQALASNGLAPYEYTFGGDIDEITQSSGMLNDLNHGIYNIMATDANGCIAETKAEITARYYKPEVNFSLITDGLTVATKNNTRAATSYEWNFGDETIILEEAPSHIYNEYNSYYVSLTATNDYGSKTVRKLVTLTPKTAINQTMESGLSIKTYPNPSNGIFTLSYSSNKTIGNLIVKIRNTTGQLISTEKFNVAAKEMSKEFDINGIAPGLYFVETISESDILTQQIVIK